MATFDQIKAIRLKIDDPSGVINIISGLPGTLAKQTAYLSGGKYYIADEAAPTVQIEADLYLSDATIGAFIDTPLTTEKTIIKCLQIIIAKIGKELRATRIASGAESADYVSLKDAYDYYRGLIQIWKEEDAENLNVSTGVIGKIKDPEIAGGLV